MTDEPLDPYEPTTDELEHLHSLLADPAAWTEPSPELEDRIVAAITDERDRSARSVTPPPERRTGAIADPDDAVVALSERSGRGRRRFAVLAVAAALLVAALAGGAVVRSRIGPQLEEVALAGGPSAPNASAVAEIDETANGVRIVLKVSDLDPAPPGTFYAGWVVREDPASRVGIGSFHQRGGDGEVELWAGVSVDDYPIVSVTLQREDDPAGPGEPVLRGRRQP